MGSGWTIMSFDRSRWDAIFGGGFPGAEQKILDDLLWDTDGYFDDDGVRPAPNREQLLASPKGQQARALASHLARNGFTYHGLSVSQSAMLDKYGCLMWSQWSRVEGNLWDVLDAKVHSPDYYPPTRELLYRVGHVRRLRLFGPRRDPLLARVPVRLLPLLLTGRRYGTKAAPSGAHGEYYIILSPSEVRELRDEVVVAINVPMPWQFPEADPELTREFLFAPLAEIVKSGRWGAMWWAQ